MAATGGVKMMLVYEHKTKGRKLIPGGLSIMDEYDLTMVISGNPDMRMVTKSITPGKTSVDLFKIDLLAEHEKLASANALKKSKGGKGSEDEEVPWKVFFGHELEGHTFNELVILTPETVEQNLPLNSKRTPTG